ncbi:MAG: AI-2E family transporter [Bacteroides sp.]|nr:AI-2E family transporter [Bacteroides sp.]MCM1413206.1 AI-2E family transporter [Bacteroides sp.]MCM1472052.1 AI-2E family transporter [Bacteroides sp.]
MSRRKPITFDQVVRAIIVIAFTLAAIWLVNDLKNVLLPFCVACLIAYVLEPVVIFQQKHLRLKSRVIPVFLTLLEAIIIVGGLACIIVPSAINEINQLDNMIKSSPTDASNHIFAPEIQHYIEHYINLDNLRHFLEPQQLARMFSEGTSWISATLDTLMNVIEWLLTFIYVIFIMIDYRQLMNGFRKVVPPRYRSKVYPIFDNIKDNMDRYFRSQAVIAACAAVFYCIGFSIVGLPLAIVMGVIVGILYMIPYVQYVTLIPVTILCWLYSLTGAVEFWPEMGKCILVYVISQCICDYLLTPKIMGKSLGLNPAIILLSLSVWGTLLGIIGMIIALPVTALLIAYYKQYILSPTDDDEEDTSNTNSEASALKE